MRISAIFKAISDPFRRDIIKMLKAGRMSAGEISSKTTLTDATVSYHLKRLRKVGLIEETKYKTFVFYELNVQALEDVQEWINELHIQN